MDRTSLKKTLAEAAGMGLMWGAVGLVPGFLMEGDLGLRLAKVAAKSVGFAVAGCLTVMVARKSEAFAEPDPLGRTQS